MQTIVVVVVVPDSPGGPTLEELRRRLDVRERDERAELIRRLSAEPCKCCSCVEADIQAWEEREGRRDFWYGF